VTFESGSKLTRIESQVFSGCEALNFIRIPPSIRALNANWWEGSSLTSVVFESGRSLRTIIEHGEVDLNGNFGIYIFGWDGVMSFPGYSVSIVPGVEDFVQLVKND
jgi:hypothetical protein